MEPYYDSEEEIAWGPISLREIKADLNRPILRLPKRRHTAMGSFQMNLSDMDSDIPESHSEVTTDASSRGVANKLDISETPTEYHTPNGSLRCERNGGFLEKLSKVINNPQTELSAYTSALENTKTSVTTEMQSKNESFKSVQGSRDSNSPYLSLVDSPNTEGSCLDFLKVAAGHKTIYDIANFQQTLVENTFSLYEDERVVADPLDCSNSEDSLPEELSCENRYTLVQTRISSAQTENIILISDDENSSNGSEYGEESCKSFIKNETDFENEMYENKREMEKIDEDTSICESGKSDTEIYTTAGDNELLSVSPIIIPEIDLTQFDDSVSKGDSPQFNDTLEEMTKFLNQGVNYTMSDEDSITEDTPVKKEESKPKLSFSPCDIISGSYPQNTPNNSFLSRQKLNRLPVRKIQQLVPGICQSNRYNLVKTSPNTNFKVPVTPVRTKLTNPTPPKSNTNHLKNVVSPVALYIKNSPRIALKCNVPQKELSKIVTAKTSKSSSKENSPPSMPEVAYKPSKKQIISKEKEISLPSSFKRLNIKEPGIIKHEGRINQNVNKTKVNRKLLQNDITNDSINASVLNSSNDTSVLTKKQAYIK